MKVIRAEVLGFCMGVRRAVEAVQSIIAERKNFESSADVYSMGPLIHNPAVLKELEQKGVGILTEQTIDSLKENSIVVIRAHGVPIEIYEKLKLKNTVIKDATCPRVKASQKCAEKFSQAGYTIILAGDAGHGEVLGIASFAGDNFVLVQNRNEALKLFENEFKDLEILNKKVILLAQTTFSPIEYEAISEILQKKIPSIKVFNTICSATQERQTALEKLRGKVDGILVIGGKNSANTRRLLFMAQKLSEHAALIEKSSEIPKEFFCLETVGITAGASTPADIIDDVEDALKANSKEC